VLKCIWKTEVRIQRTLSMIDDLAHSSVKAKATLEAIRERYSSKKVIVIFDPHASSLSDRKSLEWYPGTFDLADEVIIPQVKSTNQHLKS